jgi:flavin reductase (DIM6/NTAB) family NADH-FMN oxidoreductase RutF
MVMAVVRPQRYTLEFLDAAEMFTLSFFPEEYRPALNLCGSKSGRDLDKIKAAGLNPVAGNGGAVYFEEADLVYVCKKSFRHHITPDELLLPHTAADIYPKEDYHVIFFGEIVECLQTRV